MFLKLTTSYAVKVGMHTWELANNLKAAGLLSACNLPLIACSDVGHINGV